MDYSLKIIHLIPAVLALMLGIVILLSTKGTPTHKALGRTWLIFMFVVAVSSVAIQSFMPVLGSFGYIHILSAVTLLTLPMGVIAIRAGHPRLHAVIMVSNFSGLCIAGFFALVIPNRIIYQLLFN